MSRSARFDSTPRTRAWPVRSERPGADYRIFRSRFDAVVNPRTGVEMDRVVLEAPDWVNVVALTPARDVVIVRQRRFGTRAETIEIPGGMIDPGEDPLVAARRELREETGFTSDRWTAIGSVAPNPAFLDNRCFHFLAEDCRESEEQALDGGEDILVETVPLDEVATAIRTGDIDHALVLTALMRVVDLSRHAGDH